MVRPKPVLTPLPSDRRAAPGHLRPATAEWWDLLVDEFRFAEQDYPILEGACSAWDRAVEAREAIARDGLVTLDRFGSPKVHPAASAERESLLVFARLLRELGLDLAPPDSRPPSRVRR
ncbi:MAG TPA: P27 family phage terminase small subunit [Candidatus Limnocylindrales bacterium]|nr:P27 family phage terminase small subunit [Candidatus Limnocylindrales bacterium]